MRVYDDMNDTFKGLIVDDGQLDQLSANNDKIVALEQRIEFIRNLHGLAAQLRDYESQKNNKINSLKRLAKENVEQPITLQNMIKGHNRRSSF